MIGVICANEERETVREFFELFKTPWEFCRSGQRYDVGICRRGEEGRIQADLLFVFGPERGNGGEAGEDPESEGKLLIDGQGRELPVYCGSAVFPAPPEARPLLRAKEGGETAAAGYRSGEGKVLRAGLDLFKEVEFLLGRGQPVRHARIPSLDVLISMMREWIIGSGMSLAEIPPVPPGFDFICCLTHDVDFAGIRPHFFDRTLAGFLYRASLGSLKKALKGEERGGNLLENWKALCRLPGVYLGWAEDFWLEFERYLEMEKGMGGTYYFIPFRNTPGRAKSGEAPRSRSCKYDLEGLREEIEKLKKRGCEIGLHGIDAWADPERGRAELGRIRSLAGEGESGVRMHWLYFGPSSPRNLEEAGFSYDSTLGYNEAVGYRAGTTQVFKLPGVAALLEIPLHLQDTALFYPDRMNLSPARAMERVEELIQNAEKHGGVLTVNWHTRSLSPERLWGDFYDQMLKKISAKRVWFGTAGQVVRWFRKRRSISLEGASDGEFLLPGESGAGKTEPALQAIIHRPGMGPLGLGSGVRGKAARFPGGANMAAAGPAVP